ncbi:MULTISPECIES: cytochrome P450 [unclassified Mycobacterium]|uniref:cytochrome P450 n=1 Tax=unclassified Mycobacterium TaxID=2642494 RepID=UPI0029C90AB3|nr:MULTISPECIES: cytochrome P450 [unclassified Mycobacterium]
MHEIVNESANVLADPMSYTDETRLHEALRTVRSQTPIAWVDREPYRPFWAVSKHADVMEIERAHTVFVNEPRSILVAAEFEDFTRAQAAAGIGLRTLINLDGVEHRVMRAIGADWFRPKAIRTMQLRINDLAKRHVDDMAALGGTCDFVQEVAVNYPAFVILSLLGLPESDLPLMIRLTQELFGQSDTEFSVGDVEKSFGTVVEFFEYFAALTAARRRNPTDDMASAIANARVDGELLSDVAAFSYYTILATAGHDTTSATIAGGLLALIENPAERRRLAETPELMPLATEEMIRWVSPVKAFMRRATQSTVIRGVPIAEGEDVLLSYVSANRDEDVFVDPLRFDVGREPNRHLGFGFGVHFCLGAGLARMEIASFFRELVPRLESIQLSGSPECMATTFVGGLKHLPIEYTLR